MPRSSSKLWPPSRAPRNVRSAMSHLLNMGPRVFTQHNDPVRVEIPSRVVLLCVVPHPAYPSWRMPHTAGADSRGWRLRSLDDHRGSVTRLTDAAFRVEAEQEEAAEQEEDDQRDDRGPVGPGQLVHQREQHAPEP